MTEKLSHGEPTFFVRKKVFAMFANNHHNDGHIAVWLPAPLGIQAMLIEALPEKFFKPPESKDTAASPRAADTSAPPRRLANSGPQARGKKILSAPAWSVILSPYVLRAACFYLF